MGSLGRSASGTMTGTEGAFYVAAFFLFSFLKKSFRLDFLSAIDVKKTKGVESVLLLVDNNYNSAIKFEIRSGHSTFFGFSIVPLCVSSVTPDLKDL